ncbi:DUF7262 family protein [Haloplanus salinus]|jgi:hypothetical protein|nr:hypothetical protein [Haloplanus salinus]
MHRGQLSLTVVEAAVGVVLVMGVAAGFTVVSTGPPPSTAELDTLANDATTILASEPTEGGRDARLVELARSEESFAAVRSSAHDRLVDLLPADVLFRVRTPHGSFGHPQPPTTPVGSTTVSTRYGPVSIRVWYG